MNVDDKCEYEWYICVYVQYIHTNTHRYIKVEKPFVSVIKNPEDIRKRLT